MVIRCETRLGGRSAVFCFALSAVGALTARTMALPVAVGPPPLATANPGHQDVGHDRDLAAAWRVGSAPAAPSAAAASSPAAARVGSPLARGHHHPAPATASAAPLATPSTAARARSASSATADEAVDRNGHGGLSVFDRARAQARAPATPDELQARQRTLSDATRVLRLRRSRALAQVCLPPQFTPNRAARQELLPHGQGGSAAHAFEWCAAGTTVFCAVCAKLVVGLRGLRGAVVARAV